MNGKITCVLILTLLVIPAISVIATDMDLPPSYFKNFPPSAPYISGPTSGKIGNTYNYTIFSIDPEGDNVYYLIEWGDCDITEEWLGPFESGETFKCCHCWSEIDFPGGCNVTVRACARDSYNHTSDWSEFRVIMPTVRSRSYLETSLAFLLQKIFYWLNFLEKLINIL